MSNNNNIKQLAASFLDFRRHSTEIPTGSAVYNSLVSVIAELLRNPDTCVKKLEELFCSQLPDTLCIEEECNDLLEDLQTFISNKFSNNEIIEEDADSFNEEGLFPLSFIKTESYLS